MLRVSKSTRLGQSHHAASIWSTLERAQQLLLAWQGRPPGGTRHRIPCRWMKSQLLKFLFVVASQRIDYPAESRMVVFWATIFCPLMPGGCIKSSQCQWWSRLFPIGQLVWEEDGSLSKTTKLLLLDSREDLKMKVDVMMTFFFINQRMELLAPQSGAHTIAPHRDPNPIPIQSHL